MERLELVRCLGVPLRVVAPRQVVVEEREPERFMAAFGEAVAAGSTVFVADPSWGAAERARFDELTSAEFKTENSRPRQSLGWLCLPTGGSSGKLRLTRHDQGTVSAAVSGCCTHFQVRQINAVGVLPLHHVSGLMAWMRCALTGGRYLPWSWTEMEGGRWPETGKGDWFLSLVPTQLQRLLDRPEAADRLRRFRAIFFGGGPAWPDLLDRAAEARVPLAPGYGMTETAAMVTALRPEEFLAGRRGCGSPLPHARVELGAEGVIQITADSLFRGYHPHGRKAGPWVTDDVGLIDESGGLHVLGRRDAVIITGGKKVDPGEVEAALRTTGQFADVAVIGVPDTEWGEAVVACYPAGPKKPDVATVRERIRGELAPYKRPKRYVCLALWPRNDQGKVNRPELTALALAAVGRVRRNDA